MKIVYCHFLILFVAFTAIDTDITSWGGTIVTPGMSAYNKEEHKKQELGDEEQDGEQKGTEEEEITEGSEDKMES